MMKDLIEVCVPVAVQCSVRFYIEPGEELTAKKINEAVNDLASAASNDVFRAHTVNSVMGDFSLNVLGVERDGSADFYNGEKDWSAQLPDGVEYAE